MHIKRKLIIKKQIELQRSVVANCSETSRQCSSLGCDTRNSIETQQRRYNITATAAKGGLSKESILYVP